MFVIIFAVVVSERYSIAAIVFAGRLSFFAVGTFYMLKGVKEIFLCRFCCWNYLRNKGIF